ncbi:MAG: GNAT family N-acetyltransferase [Deltaproteobacteria bacterium]|nr:GNAT family N-acetyltransferase [Deltaproteobacteria bacterium]
MWKTDYEKKKVSPEDIIGAIRPGARIFIEAGCGEPQYLVKRLIIENKELSDIEIYTTIPLSGFSEFGGEFGSRFRVKTFFVSPIISSAFDQGRADHTPISSFNLTRLITGGHVKIDTAIVHLSAPDEHGYMSLGICVDITRTIIEYADTVIAQVNKEMPRTMGDGFMHVDKIDYIVEHDEALIEDTPEEPDAETGLVGENISKLIDDGATIQIGFGRLPNAALYALEGKRNIGIHTEILTDPICDLVKNGVITNRKKGINTDKIVASLCLGTKKLFDFVHNNPQVEFRPLEYTNDPVLIGRHNKMVAINGAVEIDLTGQSCVAMSDHMGYFGTLGHTDFNHGAMLSEGGKAIIALRSTSRDGRLSRIVPEFTDKKIGVITTQADVNYVVTEYGSVNLFGKSIRERTLALITIAHPKFRAWLLKEAKRLKYVYKDQMLPPEYAIYPEKYEIRKVFDGTELFIRPIKITDERGIQDLFYTMSKVDKFHRFLRSLSALHHQQAQPLVNVDYKSAMALVVTEARNKDGKILAVAHYTRDTASVSSEDTCEFAIIVHPNWQNMGIGSFLLGCLIDIAKNNGFTHMSAYVWEDNVQMLHVFEKAGYKIEYSLNNHVYDLSIDLGASKVNHE